MDFDASPNGKITIFFHIKGTIKHIVLTLNAFSFIPHLGNKVQETTHDLRDITFLMVTLFTLTAHMNIRKSIDS